MRVVQFYVLFYCHLCKSRLNLHKRINTVEYVEVGILWQLTQSDSECVIPAGPDSKMFNTCCQRHHHSLSGNSLFWHWKQTGGFHSEGTLHSCRDMLKRCWRAFANWLADDSSTPGLKLSQIAAWLSSHSPGWHHDGQTEEWVEAGVLVFVCDGQD